MGFDWLPSEVVAGARDGMPDPVKRCACLGVRHGCLLCVGQSSPEAGGSPKEGSPHPHLQREVGRARPPQGRTGRRLKESPRNGGAAVTSAAEEPRTGPSPTLLGESKTWLQHTRCLGGRRASVSAANETRTFEENEGRQPRSQQLRFKAPIFTTSGLPDQPAGAIDEPHVAYRHREPVRASFGPDLRVERHPA